MNRIPVIGQIIIETIIPYWMIVKLEVIKKV